MIPNLPPLVSAIGLGTAACLAAVGCRRGPARVYPPKVDFDKAAATAVAQLDADGDSLLTADELRGCPGIHSVRGRYDADGDRAVSAGEIAARLRSLSNGGKTGLYSVAVRFLLNGEPLVGARVELTPEAFLGDALQPGRGETRIGGLLRPVTSGVGDQPLNGMQPGIYRIAVTGPTDAVTERYGDGAELGLEVSEACLGSNIVFRLTTR